MIRIVRSQDKNGLFVCITSGYPLADKLEIDFVRSCASEIECALLHQHVEKKLAMLFEEIRRISYLRGWRDAKSKRRKSTSFVSCFRLIDWEKKEAGLI